MTAFDMVKKLCNDQGISVNILEERIGLGRNTLYSWKKKVPSGSNLIKVADYFNVSTDFLLGRTDDSHIETIAAHHDGEEWTDEELREIEQFKEFIRLKRKHQE